MDAAIESAPVATGVANAINQTPTNAMLLDILIRNISASMLLFALATTALAQEVRRESISLDQFNELRLVPVTISDREIVDYQVSGERWSVVIPATHTGVTGWVAGRYLVESAAPRRPAMAEGGPIGNGVPFDATGLVPCAACVGEPAALQVHSCFAYGWLS